MSGLVSEKIEEYISEHTSDVSEVLAELERKTFLNELKPRMLSGKVQGKLLSIISKMVKPKSILELGTYTGYSAICLAEGLCEGGRLITIDVNEEREDLVHQFIKKSGFENKIKPIIGDAVDIIPQLDLTFDIVFIDADKINYSVYYDMIIDKVRSGGIILVDNVLWSGKIVQAVEDKSTLALQKFNDKVQQDERVENVILSVRDGITLIYKK